MVDFSEDIAKIGKRLAAAKLSSEKLQETTSRSNYVVSIPENVRTANSKKVCLWGVVVCGSSTDALSRLQMRMYETEIATFEHQYICSGNPSNQLGIPRDCL